MSRHAATGLVSARGPPQPRRASAVRHLPRVPADTDRYATALPDLPADQLDPDDQTRDHLSGRAAELDVPNFCGCPLFRRACRHTLAVADHGLSLDIWRILIEADDPEQFADRPVPLPGDARTFHDRLDELILRHERGVGLWNPADACMPASHDALSHIAEDPLTGELILEVVHAPITKPIGGRVCLDDWL